MVLGTQSGSCPAASSCSLNTSMAFSHWFPSAEMRACTGTRWCDAGCHAECHTGGMHDSSHMSGTCRTEYVMVFGCRSERSRSACRTSMAYDVRECSPSKSGHHQAFPHARQQACLRTPTSQGPAFLPAWSHLLPGLWRPVLAAQLQQRGEAAHAWLERRIRNDALHLSRGQRRMPDSRFELLLRRVNEMCVGHDSWASSPVIEVARVSTLKHVSTIVAGACPAASGCGAVQGEEPAFNRQEVSSGCLVIASAHSVGSAHDQHRTTSWRTDLSMLLMHCMHQNKHQIVTNVPDLYGRSAPPLLLLGPCSLPRPPGPLPGGLRRASASWLPAAAMSGLGLPQWSSSPRGAA